MFKKILIANRGEIALRIQRACREMGIRAVVVHSEADTRAKYVKLADESVCIGPAPSRDSYLNIPAIISAAEVTDAEAIHPGYGFLSENADFAERVEKSGFCFIGPRPESIRLMGDKVSAKQAMAAAGVPDRSRVERSPARRRARDREDRALGRLSGHHQGRWRRRRARHAGGAHRSGAAQRGHHDHGRRRRRRSAIRPSIWRSSSRTRATSRSRSWPTSIATPCGWAIATARCSAVTRRSSRKRRRPGITRRLVDKIGDRCVEACRKINYRGAGTFEFLFENGEFYFIEMNTRLQVEHPVTEMVTGVDIVQEQIRVAAGEKLRFRQRDVAQKGHAIECRINAEDPTSSPRRRDASPRGIRPAGPECASTRTPTRATSCRPNYDSMIGKVICYGDTREQALARMRVAMSEMIVEGISTNIPLHRELLIDEKFMLGGTSIHYLEKRLAARQVG